MVSVGMVKVTMHEVIHVVTMGHGLVAAVRSVNVLLSVSGTLVGRRAVLGIR